MNLRRAGLALGISTVMVVAIAALLPRGYFANDDIGLTEYLRKHVFTPWMSPILVQALGTAYDAARNVPWYGLYLYVLIIVTGAVLIHTCVDLIDQRPGRGRMATLLGAMVLCASHTILAIGITWTAVSIAALGVATTSFIAHMQICQAAGKPMSRLRALVLGLLFVNGYMLRRDGLGAMAVAMLPVLGWAALRLVQQRRMPRLGALIAGLAPFAIVVATQNQIPQARGADTNDFERFNLARGRIHGQAAYEELDQRAPEVLARAGWSAQDYYDFTSWLLIDESDFPLEKLERLLATGGVPRAITPAWAKQQLRIVYAESAVSVLLCITMVIAGLMLAWLRVIERWPGLIFSLGYLAFLTAVPLWMAAHYRFPQRVSLSFYTVAALGMFLFLAREIARRPGDPEMPPSRDRRAAVALAVVVVFLFGWARQLLIFLDRQPWPSRDVTQALEDRVATRNAFVFVFVQAGLVEMDPLRAEPRSYDGLQGGWGTFSNIWYENIARLGVHRGADLLGAMLDNPEAYLLAWPYARGNLEAWIRRKLHNQSARLAFVDGAALGDFGPELYRVVTRPLTPGDDESLALERNERALRQALPQPPGVSSMVFRSIELTAPYDGYRSQLRQPVSRIVISSVDGGLRCAVGGESLDGCAASGELGHYAGVHIPVQGLRAVRFEVTLIDSDNVVSFHVQAQTATSRSVRWRWELGPDPHKLRIPGTLTLVPGYTAPPFELTVNTAAPAEIRDLDIFVAIKPGTHAAFELRHLEVAGQ